MNKMTFQAETMKDLETTISEFTFKETEFNKQIKKLKEEVERIEQRRVDQLAEFTEFKNVNEQLKVERDMYKKQIKQNKLIYEEEVQIYKDKLDQARHQLSISQMPYEDLCSQYVRLKEKYYKLKEQHKVAMTEHSFLRKNYLRFLIQKQWARLTNEAYKERLKEKKEEIMYQDAIIGENKAEITMLYKLADDHEKEKQLLQS